MEGGGAYHAVAHIQCLPQQVRPQDGGQVPLPPSLQLFVEEVVALPGYALDRAPLRRRGYDGSGRVSRSVVLAYVLAAVLPQLLLPPGAVGEVGNYDGLEDEPSLVHGVVASHLGRHGDWDSCVVERMRVRV